MYHTSFTWKIFTGEVNFQRGCLDAHNELRQRYGIAPLVWSAELADMAHAWAVKLSDRGRMLYPELPGELLLLGHWVTEEFPVVSEFEESQYCLLGIGENILITEANEHSHLPTGAEVVAGWEAEVEQFDFDRPRWNPSTLPFSAFLNSILLMGCKIWIKFRVPALFTNDLEGYDRTGGGSRMEHCQELRGRRVFLPTKRELECSRRIRIQRSIQGLLHVAGSQPGRPDQALRDDIGASRP
ncbi:SCP-like protein [Ancylostoma ceylanicum]|uniref:SCP-like protein n=1 Tax=Ancylostoma ceylanicum TaxID=53326 RepID=A0A0D6L9X6_9BILA|nr:SCP-like protein [Ancylostoma ceylanicum]